MNNEFFENVETYVDRSRYTTISPRGEKEISFSFREKNNWMPINKRGEFKLIDKSMLNIDLRYQREKKSESKINNIAKSFDWRIFGAISVVLRDDNSMWIYDGGHRWRAACKRDDIDMIPCIVFNSDGLRDEADIFFKKNTTSNAVSPYHKFRANLIKGDEKTIKANSIVEKYGYKISQYSSSNSYEFYAPAAILKAVSRDEFLADKIFCLCSKISKGGRISGDLILGLFWLSKNSDKDIFKKIYVDKLVSIGVIGIESEVVRKKAIIGKGGEAVYGAALRDILNKNRRTNMINIRIN